VLDSRPDNPPSRAAWERYKRLSAGKPRPLAPPAPAAAEIETAARIATRMRVLNPLDGLGRERAFGTNDLLPVNYLLLGARVARAVGRLQVRDLAGRHQGFGTGFLISPSLLLTNHHVLDTVEVASRSLLEFDVEEDEQFRPRLRRTFRLDPLRFFHSDADLDFAIVAVVSRSQDDTPLAGYGALGLIEESGKALVNEAVSIVQHPEGSDKQIALRNNHVLGVLDDFIQYTTDTKTGSSGAPVFNDQWQVVAVHRRSVARRNERGEVVARDGRVWDESMGLDEVDWVSNEGVRISSLVARLRAKADWAPAHTTLLAEAGIRGLRSAAELEPTAVVARPALPRPLVPAGISLAQFRQLVDSPNTTEADLAPYVQPVAGPRAFDPVFRLNTNLVFDPRGFESDAALTWANDWCRNRRHRAYRRKVRDGGNPIRIVSEGDSWFQYPFILDDVIDHLMAEPDLAVLSLDAGGDLISGMIASGEYLTAIEAEQPSVFLISGGGNDMVGDGRLSSRLHAFAPDRRPQDYPNAEFDAFLLEMRDSYRRLFASVKALVPGIHIFCHAYDYPRPRAGGDWLGQPMRRNGITDETLQLQVMAVVMDRVAALLAGVVTEFSGVTFLDLRGRVAPGEWYDELHPTSRGFKRVADVFLHAIRGLSI